jgi:hypothetical protein
VKTEIHTSAAGYQMLVTWNVSFIPSTSTKEILVLEFIGIPYTSVILVYAY